MHSIDSAYSDRCSVVCVCACVSVGWARSTDVSATRRFDDTFWTFRRQISVNVELLK